MSISQDKLFLLIFAMISLQMLLSLLQVKRYKKALNSLRGTGIIGIGHTKGGFKKGQIILLSYNRKNDRIVACKKMRGITIFAQFKESDDFNGKSLETVREIALEEDAKEFKRRRKKYPYKESEITKKKGALIQAVEAIRTQMQKDDQKAAYVQKNKRIPEANCRKSELNKIQSGKNTGN